MKRICRYLQGTQYNVLVFNPSKKLDVDCYADTDFAGLWGHVYPQDSICARSRTGFVVIFAKLLSFVYVKTTDRDSSFYFTF